MGIPGGGRIISAFEERSLRVKVSRRTSTPAWIDAHFVTTFHRGDEVRVFVPAYPPPAENTPMLLCVTCGRYYPRYYFVEDCCSCIDCEAVPSHREVGWGPGVGVFGEMMGRWRVKAREARARRRAAKKARNTPPRKSA